MSNELDSEKTTSLKMGTSWMELARCRDVDPRSFSLKTGQGCLPRSGSVPSAW